MINKYLFPIKLFIKNNIQSLVWSLKGRPLPPPHSIKQKNILRAAKKNKIHTLVETGTFRGDMIFAMKNHFSKLYSIELSDDLYHKALVRFKEYKHITLLNGDSGDVLEKIIPTLSTTTLFWLDGHYSGGETAKGAKETPIFEELHHILKSNLKHVLLIDDARLFGNDPAYPSFQEVASLILSYDTNRKVFIRDDIIFAIPLNHAERQT